MKLTTPGCLAILAALLLCDAAAAQSPRILYTWNGAGNVREWMRHFGENAVAIENAIEGELTVTELGEGEAAGKGVAIADGFNVIAEDGPSQGGLDLTGLDALEFDLGHDGQGPVAAQFYVSATPGFDFVGLGPDQMVEPGVKTYQAPLGDLTPAQIAYIRVIGVNIREHVAEGNLVWTFREVRSAGEPLSSRDFAAHEPGSSDNGLQGAIVNFDQASVEGNDGGQNQTGLLHNIAEPPPGNTGSLRWKDLAGGNGAAVTWGNGTAFGGNTFNERPTDMSNYTRIIARMAATSLEGGFVEGVGVQYFLQTGNFNFHVAGSLATLPADGEYHELEFSITGVPRLDFVDQHGINLQSHAGGDLLIDIDFIRAASGTDIIDCNSNRVPDQRDILDGTSRDCNDNGIPDECDIQAGSSKDCNLNRIPDDCEIAGGPARRVLYTWDDLDDVRGWMKLFGPNEVILENSEDGELTAIEEGAAPGASVAISDGFNVISEGGASEGGLDLKGMSVLEYEMGHDGFLDVNVQFFVQATPDFTYIALGPDVAVKPGIAVYTLPLGGLSPAQITYIRTIGLNIRDHTDQGNLRWTIREVQAVGERLAQRDYATHEPGSSDSGLQGAIVAFDNIAVRDNDGAQNQTGLIHNTGATPPGNTGSLRWIDLAGQNGGGVAWFNGTAWGGNTFNERPTDMSNFDRIAVRMAATFLEGGAGGEVGVQYFLQTGNFSFHPAGPARVLPADGEFHELTFSIAGIPNLFFVDAHGIDLQEHADDLIIDVDNIRAIADTTGERDCNGNGAPDDCDIASGRATDANGDGIPDECQGPTEVFRRGDSNADRELDISDPINTLSFLFLGGIEIVCQDAADADDSGELDITDAVRSLERLFLGGDPLPAPGAEACGADPTTDTLPACAYPAALCR